MPNSLRRSRDVVQGRLESSEMSIPYIHDRKEFPSH